MYLNVKNKRGFTLIELLIVIAIIAILAAVVFVSLDPLRRFKDTRDSRRWQDVTNIMTAIKLEQIDGGGYYLSVIDNMASDTVYMIGTSGTTCSDHNANCDTNVAGINYCVDLADLVTDGYLAAIPINPNGTGNWSALTTGYTLERDTSNDGLYVRSCESENSTEIYVVR